MLPVATPPFALSLSKGCPSLRAFASSRESFSRSSSAWLAGFGSREAAKARRKLVTNLLVVFLAAGLSVKISPVSACPKAIDRTSEADVVILGSGLFSEHKGGGLVRVDKLVKGKAARLIFVRVDYGAIDYDCSDITDMRANGKKSGKFFLRRSNTGQLSLFQFYMAPPRVK